LITAHLTEMFFWYFIILIFTLREICPYIEPFKFCKIQLQTSTWITEHRDDGFRAPPLTLDHCYPKIPHALSPVTGVKLVHL